MASGSDGEDLNDVVKTLNSLSLHEPPLPSLSFDLIAEILCRLPVKLLLQLRCLCKSFNSLISDPKFAKKHLRFSTTRHHLMVSSMNNSRRFHEFILFDSTIPSMFSNTCTLVTQTHPNYPDCLKNSYDVPLRLCSCDGILCFSMDKGSAVLWNPSINKFKILPNIKRSFYSFGYDHFIHNYKIIAVSFCEDKKNEVSVHTLGTDSWRRIQDFPYFGSSQSLGVFVSGTVNWLAFDASSSSPESTRVIVSLHLENESYQKLSQPDLKMDMRTLGVLNDCLCIFASSPMFLDVWIMKEYGNKESWTKLYNVPYMSDQSMYAYTKILYIYEDEQMLMDFNLLGSSKLKLGVYDSKNGTLKIPQNQNINRWMNPEVYVESLISPCS